MRVKETVLNPSIFMIAGEPSGDALGGALMRCLKESRPDISVIGIGGASMQAQGLKSLLPMSELCVMGLWEVLAHLSRLRRLIDAMVEEIEKRQPDMFVSIDLPDFNFRVAQKLKKRGIFKGKIVHYVAPSVWAWRPGRAKKIARFLDGLICLFPFEPAYFTQQGLRAEFAGHPLVEVKKFEMSKTSLRKKLGIEAEDVCIGLFLGSRERELKTLSPILIESLVTLYEQYPDIKVIVPTLPHLEYEVSQITRTLPMPVYIVSDQKFKWLSFAACDFAVAVSGTVGLELAYVGVPHVIAYRMNPLTALILKAIVKVKYAHLANILLGREVVPECIQNRCTAYNITAELLGLVRYPEKCAQQSKDFAELEAMLKPEGVEKPSHKAVDFILDALKA